MNKTTKTILIVIGSVLFVCACITAGIFATGLWSFGRFVRWADHSVSEDPQTAVRVGSEITDFEVPEGFDSPYNIHFEDMTIVAYKFGTPVLVEYVAGPMLGMPPTWQAFLSMTRIDDALTVMLSALAFRASMSIKFKTNNFWLRGVGGAG